jgi:hypothetical protein
VLASQGERLLVAEACTVRDCFVEVARAEASAKSGAHLSDPLGGTVRQCV